MKLLTHFSPVSHFYTPWKRQNCDTGLKWVNRTLNSFDSNIDKENLFNIATGKAVSYDVSNLLLNVAIKCR